MENAENECVSYQDIADAQDYLGELKDKGMQDSDEYFELANAVFGCDPFDIEGSIKAYRKRASSKLTKGKISNKRKCAAMYSNFNNFDELKNDGRYGYLAEMLIDEYDEGEWQNNTIYIYDSVEDFAEYELYDGWYAYMIERADYNGAPDPFDYIDMTAFGDALTSSFDESLYCELDGHVIETTYGW